LSAKLLFTGCSGALTGATAVADDSGAEDDGVCVTGGFVEGFFCHGT